MDNGKCMCHFNGYEVKDASARRDLAELGKEVDTERRRINNLAKLKEGSTTGDAELMDMRTDHTGKTWDTAGAAFRGVLGDHDDRISAAHSGILLINVTQSTNGSYDANRSMEEIKAAFNERKALECYANGKIFSLNAVTGSGDTLAYVFSNDDISEAKTRTITISSTGVEVASETYLTEDPRSIFLINVTAGTDGVLTPNRTNAEIKAAYDAGKVIQCYYNYAYYNMFATGGDGTAEDGTKLYKFFFTGLVPEGNRRLIIKIMADGVEIDDRWDIIPNYANFSAFRKFGVIGDSLSCGSYTSSDGTKSTDFDASWGAFAAKKCGNEFLPLGFPGATSATIIKNGYLDTAENAENECDAYIIGLGYNDNAGSGSVGFELGTAADIDTTSTDNTWGSYYFNIEKIIRRINTKFPKAHIFVLTNPYLNRTGADSYNEALREIVELMNEAAGQEKSIHLIDLYKLYKNLYLSIVSDREDNHYHPQMYAYMGQLTVTAISDYMTENPAFFKHINEGNVVIPEKKYSNPEKFSVSIMGETRSYDGSEAVSVTIPYDFKCTVTQNADGYKMSASFNELYAKSDLGYTISVVYGTNVLSLAGVTPDKMIYTGYVDGTGDVIIEHTIDNVVNLYQKPKTQVMTVDYTQDAEGNLSTHCEIGDVVAAHENGVFVRCCITVDGVSFILPLVAISYDGNALQDPILVYSATAHNQTAQITHANGGIWFNLL